MGTVLASLEWVPSTGLEPARLSAQALNLPRIPFRHEGITLRITHAFYTKACSLSIPIFSWIVRLLTAYLARTMVVLRAVKLSYVKVAKPDLRSSAAT